MLTHLFKPGVRSVLVAVYVGLPTCQVLLAAGSLSHGNCIKRRYFYCDHHSRVSDVSVVRALTPINPYFYPCLIRLGRLILLYPGVLVVNGRKSVSSDKYFLTMPTSIPEPFLFE